MYGSGVQLDFFFGRLHTVYSCTHFLRWMYRTQKSVSYFFLQFLRNFKKKYFHTFLCTAHPPEKIRATIYSRVVIRRGQRDLALSVWHSDHFSKKFPSATFIRATIQKVILRAKTAFLSLCQIRPGPTFPCTPLVLLYRKKAWPSFHLGF